MNSEHVIGVIRALGFDPDQLGDFRVTADFTIAGMGHQSHIGFVKTEAYGAAVLFRIDTPPLPEREYTLARPESGASGYYPIGAVVRRMEEPGSTVLVGAGSIYRIVPCTEDVAKHAIDAARRAPLILVAMPPEKALLPGQTVDDPVCDSCGRRESRCECAL